MARTTSRTVSLASLALARSVKTDAPTLVGRGEQDPALGTFLLHGLERFVPRVLVHRIRHAGHWVQNEAPEEVNHGLLQFQVPSRRARRG